MARKGKTPKPPLQLDKLGDVLDGMTRVLKDERNRGTFPITSTPSPRVDMTREARVKRLIGLGMTPEEVERQLTATAHATEPDRLGLDAEEATIADGIASTTLCNEHVPNADATACARCGKPVADILLSGDDVVPLDVAVDDARQSEKRFTDDEWRDLDPIRAGESDAGPVKLTERAADDGPLPFDEEDQRLATGNTSEHRGITTTTMTLDALWSMRLSILAKEAGEGPANYVTKLIRRQWVARGKGA